MELCYLKTQLFNDLKKTGDMKLVVDFQCFVTETNDFIVKELAAFDGAHMSLGIVVAISFEMMSYRTQNKVYG